MKQQQTKDTLYQRVAETLKERHRANEGRRGPKAWKLQWER